MHDSLCHFLMKFTGEEIRDFCGILTSLIIGEVLTLLLTNFLPAIFALTAITILLVYHDSISVATIY